MPRLVFSLLLLTASADFASAQRRPIRPPLPISDDRPSPVQTSKPDVVVPADTNPDPKSLDLTPEEVDNARSLARQLGSRDYQERNAASRALAKIGRAGIIALREVRAADSNPEVRLRTDILLPRAESDDMKARVLCFLADKEGKYEHKVPGWERYRTLAGTDKAARDLFSEVLRKSEYHPMLLACEVTANDLCQAMTTHYQQIQHKQNQGTYGQPSAAETAVLTFFECQHSDKAMTIQGLWGPMSVGQFLYHQEVQNAMRNGSGKYGEPLRRIVTKWMETRETAFGVQTAMNLAMNWQLKDQLRFSARMLLTDDPNYQWAKAQAAMQIAQKDAKEYLPLMLKGLDDGTLLTQVFIGRKNPNEVASVNTQDYILGLMCRMTKQKPADYGLDVQPNGGDNFQNYANWYFKETEQEKSGDKRAAGIKKFKEWAEKNMKADPPKKDEPKKAEPKKDEPKKDEPKTEAPLPPPVDLVRPLPIKK